MNNSKYSRIRNNSQDKIILRKNNNNFKKTNMNKKSKNNFNNNRTKINSLIINSIRDIIIKRTIKIIKKDFNKKLRQMMIIKEMIHKTLKVF